MTLLNFQLSVNLCLGLFPNYHPLVSAPVRSLIYSTVAILRAILNDSMSSLLLLPIAEVGVEVVLACDPPHAAVRTLMHRCRSQGLPDTIMWPA